jgi:predicted nucleic acid-binding protein
MAWLIDTNVLLRLADAESPQRSLAEAAVASLIASGTQVFISFQVVVEFWAVATRPESANGLGWSPQTAAEAIRSLREQFTLLNETPDVLDRWLDLVRRCHVAGKRTHDARLAALLIVHGVRDLLTFNTADFPADWGVHAVHPQQFATTYSPEPNP